MLMFLVVVMQEPWSNAAACTERLHAQRLFNDPPTTISLVHDLYESPSQLSTTDYRSLLPSELFGSHTLQAQGQSRVRFSRCDGHKLGRSSQSNPKTALHQGRLGEHSVSEAACIRDDRFAYRSGGPYLPLQHNFTSSEKVQKTSMPSPALGDSIQYPRLEHLLLTASLRNGYQYHVVRARSQHRELIPFMSVDHRITCVGDNNQFVSLTTAKDTNGGRIDRDALVSSLSEHNFHPFSTADLRNSDGLGPTTNGRKLLQAMVDGLRGMLGIPLEAQLNHTTTHLRPAPLSLWRSVLGVGLPASRGPGSASLEDLLISLHHYKRLPIGKVGSPFVSALWGLDDAGGVYGWGSSTAGGCLRCLRRVHDDGMFALQDPAWLWRQPVLMYQDSEGRVLRVDGKSTTIADRPLMLVTHSACRHSTPGLHLHQIVVNTDPTKTESATEHTHEARSFQCALPVWDLRTGTQGETESQSGIAVEKLPHDGYRVAESYGNDGQVVELTRRTAFYNEPLWWRHWAHFNFNWLAPSLIAWRELGADRWRDKVVWFGKDTPHDYSMLVSPGRIFRSPGLLASLAHVHGKRVSNRPKTRELHERLTTRSVSHTCFQRTVMGLARACLVRYCDHQLELHHLRYVHSTVRRHFGLGPAVGGRSTSSRRLQTMIFNRKRQRAVQNMDQLADIIRAFENVDVRVQDLNGRPSAVDNIRIFETVDLLVAPNGNAMTNVLWMPEKSAVIELHSSAGSRGSKGFSWHAAMGTRWTHWLELACWPEDLGAAITQSVAEAAAKELEGRCPDLVGADTVAKLLAVQSRIESNEYVAPEPRSTPNDTSSVYINRMPDEPGVCEMYTPQHPQGHKTSKNGMFRYIYTPPVRFLWAAVEQLQKVCEPGARAG